MKKVVHLGYEHHAKDVRIYQKECRSLASFGYDVTYITSDKHDEAGEEIIEGVRIITLPICREPRFLRIIKYWYDLLSRALECKADIYHIHEFVLIPVGKKLVKKGKKVIYDTHENYSMQISNIFPCNGLIKKVIRRTLMNYEGHFIQKTSGLICAVPNEFNLLKRYNSNHLLLNNYPIIINTGLNKEDYFSRPKCACYTGIISYKRGFECMLEGLGNVKGRLLIAGTGKGSYINMQKKHKYWDNILYYGELDRESMIEKIWSKSIVGIVLFQPLESYMEAVPNKLYEYMSAGIPVIASNFPKWISFFEKYKCGLVVDPTKPEELRNAFKKLENDIEYAYMLGQNGMKIIESELNWSVEAKKLGLFYDKI